ncbi:hypothetical protein AB1046_15090 [Promicromonospora sp. Populi]|uniref:hypothetical protein n=1 Tax=Promicromonospora sp. Populi TaxID=3239420 RepID=UPI0034E2A282
MLPIFEPSDVYSETFPVSGMTLHGSAYALPTSAPRTAGSASSSSPGTPAPRTPPVPPGWAGEPLLPTPKTTDAKGASPGDLRRSEPGLRALPLLLATPTAQLATNGGSQEPAKRRRGGHQPTLADQMEHL